MTNQGNNCSTSSHHVSIIGCGTVGITCAYALLLHPLVRRLTLIGHNWAEAEGEAMDLQHAVPLGSPVKVSAGTYKEAAESTIVILAAGAASKPSRSRLELLERNLAILRECVGQLMEEHFDGVLLIASNPVDVLALVAQRESGLPAGQVIGSGTVLDTARLRAILGAELEIDARAVHAFVIGEHGDSSLIVWSAANIAGIPLRLYPGAGKLPSNRELLTRVQQAAPEIVKRKGNTCFAIASCVTRICEAILRDEHTVLAVSTLIDGHYGLKDVYLSSPCVIGAAGVERVLELPLEKEESQALHLSATVLQSALLELQGKKK